MQGEADALTGVYGYVTNGVSFRKAPERCAADFAKIVQRGMGMLPHQAKSGSNPPCLLRTPQPLKRRMDEAS